MSTNSTCNTFSDNQISELLKFYNKIIKKNKKDIKDAIKFVQKDVDFNKMHTDSVINTIENTIHNQFIIFATKNDIKKMEIRLLTKIISLFFITQSLILTLIKYLP